MGEDVIVEFYLCPRCLLPDESAGNCHECGRERVQCCPGSPDDPCRQPLMNAMGKIETRAPRWWLQQSVIQVIRYREDE
jgi:hypothetical protein